MKRFLGMLLAGTLVLGGLSGCAQAEFVVSTLTITPSQIVAGEEFMVSTEITNVGNADGVYTATLTVNGAEVATKDIAVAAGVTETVSFTLTEETPGSYTVALNDLTASFTVLKLPSAQEIVDGMIEALDDRKSYEFEMDMSLDGTGEVEGESIKATMTLVASGALDPENRQMRFDMTASAAPWGEDESAMAVEMYLVDNMVYMMQDVTETGPMWSKEEIPETYFEQVNEQLSEQANTLTELHTELLQAAQVSIIGSEKVKGVDCYVLQLTPDVQQLWQSVAEQIALTGGVLTGGFILPYAVDQEYLQERLSFSMKQWVAKDTYFLIRAEIDMAIELNLEAMLADAAVATPVPAPTPEPAPDPTPAPAPSVAEEAQFNIDFTMSYLAYNYNQPISIQVPPEAESPAPPEPKPSAAPTPSPETVITFPDENLEAAIRDALGKPAGEAITPAELAKLTELKAEKMGITDLSGIEHCVNLTSLNLYDNQIRDLSLLASLTNLKELSLRKNEINVLWALASLTGLEELDLGINQISDISALSSLTSLKNLDLTANQISDLSPLTSLTGLKRLELNANPISDISPLVENNGLGSGDSVHLMGIPPSKMTDVYIRQLTERGVKVIKDW